MIRAVTFDFWNTLYVEGPAMNRRQRLREDYSRGFLARVGKEVADSQLSYAFGILRHDLDHYRAVRHAAFDAEEMGRRLAGAMGIRLGASEAARLGELISSAGRDEPPVPADGAMPLLTALHGRVALAIISDTGMTLGHDLYAVMEQDGIAQLLDHFTFSDQTGTTKPEVRQFHHTLYRLGCKPTQAVHVGDLEETDIVGARQAGMRAIRIVHPDGEPATAADAAVSSVGQIIDPLREWGLPV